jgi:hypothetical protein
MKFVQWKKVTAELETADAFKLTFPFFDVDELSVQECVITTSKAKIMSFLIIIYLFVVLQNGKFGFILQSS